MPNDTPEQVKVVFPSDVGAETMWADAIGDDIYRLDNVPLFAYDVNLHDVFKAKRVVGDDRPYFDHVLERSSNKTVRVTLPENRSEPDNARIHAMLAELLAASTGHSQYGEEYFVYNIPAGEAFEALATRLDEGEDDSAWDWELSVPEDG